MEDSQLMLEYSINCFHDVLKNNPDKLGELLFKSFSPVFNGVIINSEGIDKNDIVLDQSGGTMSIQITPDDNNKSLKMNYRVDFSFNETWDTENNEKLKIIKKNYDILLNEYGHFFKHDISYPRIINIIHLPHKEEEVLKMVDGFFMEDSQKIINHMFGFPSNF